MATNYINQSGTDLSFAYTAYTTGTKAKTSGYKTSTGSDLSDLFAKYVDYKGENSGYLDLSGNDLSTLYQGLRFSNMSTGANNKINSVSAYDLSHVFVGGAFTRIDDISANYIAMWNGTSWSEISNNFNGLVAGIYAYDLSHIYVCGQFSNAPYYHIAMYNSINSTWSQLGSGTTSQIVSIYVYDLSHVYVGGSFTTIGGINANYIAMWSEYSSSWSALGNGTGGSIITVHGFDLSHVYVSGNFTSVYAGTVGANYIARWNHINSAWSPLGSGLASAPNSMYALKENCVYAGISQCWLYNGSSWTGISGTNPYALYAVDSSNVYIGGDKLYFYNGITTTAFSQNTNDYVTSISPINKLNIFVGGQFTSVGGDTRCSRIVKFRN